MNFEPFSRGSSILHRTDPRVKIISAVVLSLVIATCQHFITASAGLLIGVILISSARLPIIVVMRRLLIVNGFNLLLWLLLPLTYGGPVMGRLGPLAFHAQGVALSLQITLKSVSIVTAFIALVATMDIATLGHSLLRLKVPAKVAYLLLMTYRYIFVLEQEYQRLLRAARVRGFRPGTNLHSYRTYAYLVGMLFVRASNGVPGSNAGMVISLWDAEKLEMLSGGLGGLSAGAMAYDATTQKLYSTATRFSYTWLYVDDVEGMAREAELRLDRYPVSLALRPGTHHLFLGLGESVAGSKGDDYVLRVLDTRTLGLVTEMSLPGEPVRMAVNQRNGEVYVADGEAGTVHVVRDVALSPPPPAPSMTLTP